MKRYTCTFSVDASLVRVIEAANYKEALGKALAMKNEDCLKELDEAFVRHLEHMEPSPNE